MNVGASILLTVVTKTTVFTALNLASPPNLPKSPFQKNNQNKAPSLEFILEMARSTNG